MGRSGGQALWDFTKIKSSGKVRMNWIHILKGFCRFLLDVVEKYLPVFVFFILFLTFILQIFCRYFLVPLTWPLELTLICFIWTALLGGLLAKRTNDHVAFSLIYDAVKPKVRLYMRLSGNFLLFAAFCIAIYPSYDYVAFMSFKKSNVLRIPMNIAFSPFIIFLLVMLGRIGWDIWIDLKLLFNKEKIV
jgi:TRAP-type C4-dicarboxylate transport system permease small subunit